MRTLKDFFFDILNIEINQTPSHKNNLPMKKNQSLSYAIDFDLHRKLYLDLARFATEYVFIKFEKINEELYSLHNMFPEYGNKPIPFKLIIDKDFQDLHYTYSDDRLYTFMNFKFGGRKFDLPIEKIALV